MPVFEMLTKDISEQILAWSNMLKNGLKSRKIFIYPHFPSRGSTIYKVARKMNYTITNRQPENAALCVYWEYLTHRKEYQLPEKLSLYMPVVNLHSRDISKKYVDDVFRSVFGYATIINPRQYTGKCVKKSDVNAMHDGMIVNCPIAEPDEDCIYQRLIDNSLGNEAVEDIRVPVVNGCLDFVYLKRRYISERFLNTTFDTDVIPVNQALSSTEVRKLNEFCERSGLDYGELDVLRDNSDGRIYVVDVNNTPQGPPANTPKAQGKLAIRRIAEAFSHTWLDESEK